MIANLLVVLLVDTGEFIPAASLVGYAGIAL
jgi:hypothetical protein